MLVQPMSPFEEEMAMEMLALRKQIKAIKAIVNPSKKTLTVDNESNYPSVDEE